MSRRISLHDTCPRHPHARTHPWRRQRAAVARDFAPRSRARPRSASAAGRASAASAGSRAVAAHEQDRDRRAPRRTPNASRQPTSRPEHGRARAARCSAPRPIAAPIQKLPLIARSTRPRTRAGYQLVDGRVDRRVLAADAEAREEAADRERGESRTSAPSAASPRDRPRASTRNSGLRPSRSASRPKNSAPSTAPPTYADAGPADLRRRQAERFGALQHRPERADHRDLEPVEHPRDAERDDDAPVPTRPRQRVEPRGQRAQERRILVRIRDVRHADLRKRRSCRRTLPRPGDPQPRR